MRLRDPPMIHGSCATCLMDRLAEAGWVPAGRVARRAALRHRGRRRGHDDHRVMVIPAASRSKVPGVMPSSRSFVFCTRSVGVLGRLSTKRM